MYVLQNLSQYTKLDGPTMPVQLAGISSSEIAASLRNGNRDGVDQAEINAWREWVGNVVYIESENRSSLRQVFRALKALSGTEMVEEYDSIESFLKNSWGISDPTGMIENGMGYLDTIEKLKHVSGCSNDWRDPAGYYYNKT